MSFLCGKIRCIYLDLLIIQKNSCSHEAGMILDKFDCIYSINHQKARDNFIPLTSSTHANENTQETNTPKMLADMQGSEDRHASRMKQALNPQTSLCRANKYSRIHIGQSFLFDIWRSRSQLLFVTAFLLL